MTDELQRADDELSLGTFNCSACGRDFPQACSCYWREGERVWGCVLPRSHEGQHSAFIYGLPRSGCANENFAINAARAAAIEECAKIVETTNVLHGDHYAAFAAASSDAEVLAKAIRSLLTADERDALERIRHGGRAEGLQMAVKIIQGAKGIVGKYPDEVRDALEKIKAEARRKKSSI